MRWKGQNIRRKYGDVTRFMDITALTYGYHTQKSSPHYGAVQCIEQALTNMPMDRLCVVGFVQNTTGWHVAQTTRSNQSVPFAIEFLAQNVFHAIGVIAARLGKRHQEIRTIFRCYLFHIVMVATQSRGALSV